MFGAELMTQQGLKQINLALAAAKSWRMFLDIFAVFMMNLKISLVLFSIVLIVNTPHRKTKINVTLVCLFIVSIIYFHFKERVCNSLETRVWSFLANATQTGVNSTFIRDH